MSITQKAAASSSGRTKPRSVDCDSPDDYNPAAAVLASRDAGPDGGRDPQAAQDDYLLVELLSAALAKIRLERQRTGIQAHGTAESGPLPRAWRDARGRLWWKAQTLSLEGPGNDLELFDWCRRPLGSWPVPLSLSEADLEAVLLEGDSLSEFAEQAADLVQHADVEAELVQNQVFAALMLCARMNGGDDDAVQRVYCRLRRLLIDLPVLSDREVLALAWELPATDSDHDSFLAKFVRVAYVHHPVQAPGKVRLRRCAACRNLVDDGAVGCGTPGCAGVPERHEVACLGGYWTQHRATRQFFHDPGLLEGRLLDHLGELVDDMLCVEDWPCLDAWDMALTFKDQEPSAEAECWAVDAKDCSSPALLARGFRCDSRVLARRRIIVIPMHRLKTPGYHADLERELQGRVSGVEVLDERTFLRQVTVRARQSGERR
ncbi:restriction endonuclease-related protein [Streptomyces althioticus]